MSKKSSDDEIFYGLMWFLIGIALAVLTNSWRDHADQTEKQETE